MTTTQIEKQPKKGKDPLRRQKVKKSHFYRHLVALCLDPPAFLKGPEGCPLNHRRVRIQAFHRESDLLSIHIGSWSNIELEQVTKKRVLQRVLRYYPRSTVPRCAMCTRNIPWRVLHEHAVKVIEGCTP